jgi:hypothetical protein
MFWRKKKKNKVLKGYGLLHQIMNSKIEYYKGLDDMSIKELKEFSDSVIKGLQRELDMRRIRILKARSSGR